MLGRGCRVCSWPFRSFGFRGTGLLSLHVYTNPLCDMFIFISRFWELNNLFVLWGNERD